MTSRKSSQRKANRRNARSQKAKKEASRSVTKSESQNESREPVAFWYVIDASVSRTGPKLLVQLFHGPDDITQPDLIKRWNLSKPDISCLTDPQQKHAMQELLDYALSTSPYFVLNNLLDFESGNPQRTEVAILSANNIPLLKTLAATGRLFWREDRRVPVTEAKNIVWDDGNVWEPRIDFRHDPSTNEWVLSASVVRAVGTNDSSEQEVRPFSDVVVLNSKHIVLFMDRLARIEVGAMGGWLDMFRRKSEIRIHASQRKKFLRSLTQNFELSSLPMPAEFTGAPQDLCCQPHLHILRTESLPPRMRQMPFEFGAVEFQYGDVRVRSSDRRGMIWIEKENWLLVRDEAAEAAWLKQLRERGAERIGNSFTDDQIDLKFPRDRFPAVSRELLQQKWTVDVEGMRLQTTAEIQFKVTTGIDWFDLQASVRFGDLEVGYPELLKTIRDGETTILLPDGSRGMISGELLDQCSRIAEMGQVSEDAVRFRKDQALILKTLLASQETVDRDSAFAKHSELLQTLTDRKKRGAPASFQGQLRDYQKDGLNWLWTLQQLQLGGCLADDMGLGKTVQVLALLEMRRTRRRPPGQTRKPSLMVVPKSLVSNWTREAAKFVPKMSVLEYVGANRGEILQAGTDTAHVIVTTYGTLRKDILALREISFDYIVLDEAQAIKNSRSQVSRACRLLKGDHRLAMTGTPVENHAGDLWSLFEFLHPGILSSSARFQRLIQNARSDPYDSAFLQTLSAAVQPLVLRRTKQQVLKELPEKTEQTIFCEMSGSQKTLYEELKERYREQLTAQVQEHGMKKSGIQVIEALLRLRQAACHPGLIDPEQKDHSSAKVETLLSQLQELAQEGHKALVFSQFTSLLGIVKKRLDELQMNYEYLDGKTRKRQAVVDRFQNSSECSLFLISLKAGGQGLNLTAADYVFLLDPWWNPAVEAQAIDRAHRMGQKRNVFAYRLICKDSVEERILELQNRKKDVADALISADGGLIRNLTPDDLQLLFC